MSRDLLSMGSKSKPPVFQAEEYSQWKKRMTQFLNHQNRELMLSIQNGPYKAYIDISGIAETATSQFVPPRRVEKEYRYYNEADKAKVEIDELALTYLTQAIPNDIYNRVDSRNTAKEIWDELERQFEGSSKSMKTKKNQSINAYEGFKAKDGESLKETYNRYNIILNDLRRNGVDKSESEINYKFIKNLLPEWDSYSIQLQMSRDMDDEKLTDIFSILGQHEDKVKAVKEKDKKVEESLALLSEHRKSGTVKTKALISGMSKKKMSSDDDDSDNSGDEMNDIAEKLALLTNKFQNRFGKKKFYSKTK